MENRCSVGTAGAACGNHLTAGGIPAFFGSSSGDFGVRADFYPPQKAQASKEISSFAYLEIPSIQVYLPIYHGTGSQVLEQGVGHLQNTSLPVGGEGTRTVLTGHTGLAGKRLFTDLSQVKEGEAFFLHVLGETLAYRVQETAVVEPEDTSRLVVEKGKDLATLLTCYPYGINSHRLLVFGERTPFEEAAVQGERPDGQGKAERSLWQQEYRRAVVLCLGIYIPLTLSVIWVVLHRRKNKYQPKHGKT